MSVSADHPASKADWQLGQMLFAQGVPSGRIAAQLGVSSESVRQRARRGKWSRLRTQIGQALVTTAKKALSHERDQLQKESFEARTGLSAEVLEQIRHLSSQVERGVSLDNAIGRAQACRTLAETAKTVYGWDADSAKRTIINVALMESVDEPEPGPAIDVEVGPAQIQASSDQPKE